MVSRSCFQCFLVQSASELDSQALSSLWRLWARDRARICSAAKEKQYNDLADFAGLKYMFQNILEPTENQHVHSNALMVVFSRAVKCEWAINTIT
jgi:hypothetical protein